MDDHDNEGGGRVLPFRRPGAAEEPPVETAGPVTIEDVAVDRRAVGPRELRVVVENFLGILDSFELYVQQTRSLATLWLKGGEPDAQAVNQIVANCEHDEARLAEIRAGYRRLADSLADPSNTDPTQTS